MLSILEESLIVIAEGSIAFGNAIATGTSLKIGAECLIPCTPGVDHACFGPAFVAMQSWGEHYRTKQTLCSDIVRCAQARLRRDQQLIRRNVHLER